MKNEKEPKAKLVKFLRERLENSAIFRHEDKFTAGIPDISVTHNGFTLWMEVKHVTPKKPFKSSGLQKHTARQLEKYGKCVFVIFEESKQGILTTKILFPKHIGKSDKFCFGFGLVPGFDPEFILRFIRIAMMKNQESKPKPKSESNNSRRDIHLHPGEDDISW